MNQVAAHDLTATVQPMTRLEYNQFRGWTLPEGEEPSDPGYLMNFGFHTAWWPADVVVKAFVALPPAPPHEQRMHIELHQLRDRNEKLKAFFYTDQFPSLVPAEQVRLSRQYNLQQQLIQVLGERIAAIK